MTHRARKRFGQHFLNDSAVINDIVDAINPQPRDTVVEIGPGLGAITSPLLSRSDAIQMIELDRDLVRRISDQYRDDDRVTVHEADALAFDYSSLGSDLRIVGNLPYNISTPLLFHLIDFRQDIRDMHFMLQKEVVDRMAASPGSKKYGRLTVMLGCRMEVVPLFDVPPTAFTPPPKVESTVVRMRPLAENTYAISDPEKMSQLVAAAFSQRRKTIRNALKGLATPDELQDASIDPGVRPEQVSIPNWVALSNRLSAGS